jgi:hypothetical protein
MSDDSVAQAIYAAAGLAAALAISIDASRLGARRGRLGGGFVDMGPVGWFFSCWLFWIVTVPCYLVARPRLARLNRVEGLPTFLGAHPALAPAIVAAAAYGNPAGPTFGPATGPGVAPGWYPDPFGHAPHRWWSGMNWTDHIG